ncbi:hypothetical protein Y032_0479g2217 [Ancylostoma ceylanicum]|uniref:G-protein coupled receptors family 1 profile domain-containing protein n=1 Tax=Ancylostoma ceylanicum TaxID=53326 RepID=A0A016WVJ2_9BILA|nr:hypothetical protein Y032_0479g2217 [Ancylostoma ceylanicum]
MLFTHYNFSVLSFVTLILAAVTNSVLITLICSKSSKIIGGYRYIMISFGIFNVLYSLTAFFSHPKVILIEASYMAYSGNFRGELKSVGYFSLSVFIAMYGLSTFLLAIHFVYRYVIICRPNHCYLFSSLKWKVAWVVFTLLWGLTYFSINFFIFAPSERYRDFARATVLSRANYTIDELGFFCVFIYEIIDGETIIYISYCVGLFIMVVMMFFTFVVMICCGIQIIRALERISLSSKTRNLQHQLLRALIVQATIPFIFSYLPRFLMFAFVIKGSSRNAFSAFVPYTIALYTFLDPIAIIAFIPSFRKKIFDLRRCREVVNAVSRTKPDFSLRY